MPKAVISNRIYLDVDDDLKRVLISALTYKIELKHTGRSKIKQYEIIKNYKIIGSTVMSIPQGRHDLIPSNYTIIDKRIIHEVPFPNANFELRPDQSDVVTSISNSCIINALVGWGKTFTALHLAKQLGQKTLVITHTTMLRDQWIEEIEGLYGMPVGVIGSGKFDIDHAIVVGNVQTVTKCTDKISKEFGTIILDEMHHVAATTFSSIIDTSHAKYRIGLSGTIVRTDGKHVLFRDYFGPEVHQPAQAGTLTPTIHVMKTGVMLQPGATWAQKLNTLLYDEDYQKFIAAAAKVEIARGHKVLIVAERTEFLENVGELIGSDCVCITGSNSTFDERKELISKVETGEKSAIAGSIQIFSEGISVNILSCVILASPSSNPIRLEQVIGRIMRKHPDKLDPIVLDLHFSGPDGRRYNKAKLEFYQRKGWDVYSI